MEGDFIVEERTCQKCNTIVKAARYKIGSKHKPHIIKCTGCNLFKCYQNDLANCYFRTCSICKNDLCDDCSFSKVACSKQCMIKWLNPKLSSLG